MLTHAPWRSVAFVAVLVAFGAILPSVAEAQPVVKTVPWVSTNPLIPHDTWSGKSITLKGTADVQGANIQYTWDFGDGSPVATGTVTNQYAIEAPHVYTGATGTTFTARLTILNTTTGQSASRPYFVAVRDQTLETEVNVAIDAGLWYLHKTMRRYTSSGQDFGDWMGGGNASSGYYAVSAANVNAFEIAGHVETGDPANPYVETVQRAMRRVFQMLNAQPIGLQTNPRGTVNPDTNGNGIGIYANDAYPGYQTGIFIDAIVASGTPAMVAPTGPVNVVGRQYRDIVQDMADWYCWAQYDSSPGGGWRYNFNEFPDNSAAQWGAIGLIAAQRNFGAVVPSIVKTWNRDWLSFSQLMSTGWFGYTSVSHAWGPYGTTPSGMVQLAMDGVGRGDPLWDRAETFMRNNFGNCCGATVSVKDYYYGLFALTKALLLHDSNNDGVSEPLADLRSATPGVLPIDWYAAQVTDGDPTDGVARTLINDQNAAGYWYGHNYDSRQYSFETAWAIMMLNRTLFAAGAPVAVATATPNPATVGAPVTLDGSGSFHQDASKTINAWEWDLDNNGTFEASGPSVTMSFAALGTYAVTLRVTDDATPAASASTTINVLVSFPPVAPTADAGGPYNFCIGRNWFLDGSGSVNPDEGENEPGAPSPDTIVGRFTWDLNGDGAYGDRTEVTPNVTGFWPVGSYLVQLKVCDTTSMAFPSSGQPDLCDTDSAQVVVRTATDPACSCITGLMARPKSGKVDVYWPPYGGADHINVYRGTISGGPYLKIGVVAGTSWVYVDQTVTNGVTYYYVVRPAALNTNELCQSNQAQARPIAR